MRMAREISATITAGTNAERKTEAGSTLLTPVRLAATWKDETAPMASGHRQWLAERGRSNSTSPNSARGMSGAIHPGTPRTIRISIRKTT
jgi:hypothetical protein